MRFILNIFLTHQTIMTMKRTNQPLVFLKLDFSKAYDRVDLEFLFQTLSCIGFPNCFTNMIKLLFKGAHACVSINGRTMRKFEIQQDVRQGCPVAPYLSLIVGEFLNASIKKELALGTIKGILLPGSDKQ